MGTNCNRGWNFSDIFFFSGTVVHAWREMVPLTLMTSVSPVGARPCSFARLIYTPRNVRRRSHRVLSPPASGNDQQMSRSIAQPLQLDVSRKTSTTVTLKLSKCLYKNKFYNCAEQLIALSLNCSTRKWSSCNSRQPIVENIWYWTWRYFVPKWTKVLKPEP